MGGKPASGVVVVNGTTITAITPAHAAGIVEVTVQNSDGKSGVLLNAFTYIALPAPQLLTVQPNQGPASGGTQIIVNGQNLQNGATVLLGGAPATGVTFISATQIQGTTPPNAAGTVDVLVRNPDGQVGTITAGFTYQAVPPPTLTSVTPNSGPSSGGTALTIKGTNFQTGITVSVGGVPATNVVFVSDTQIQATAPAHAAGIVSVTVRNPDNQTATLSSIFTYINPPSISLISPNSGPNTGGTTVTITGSNFQNGAVVQFGGVDATSVTFVNSTQIQAVTPARPSFSGTVSVKVLNPDGQSATNSAGFTYLTPSSVTSITPNQGPVSGGTNVSIAGTGFAAGATVTFGGTAATGVIVNNANLITAVTPAHAAGAVDVVVRNTDGSGGTLTAGFTYISAPTISSVSPSSGPITGGTSVTISGAGFAAGATVRFGATTATSIVVVDFLTITCVTPAGSAGSVNVTVQNPDGQTGTLASGFTYEQLPAPVVSGVTPNTGRTSGGTPVTITGANFQTGATVKFGGAAATSVVVVNANQITATTPAGTGTVTVQVTNPDTQSGSLASAFTFVPPPTVGSVSPNSGPVSGGTSVTITGTGFQSGATATIGGTPATSVNFVSATTLTAVTPAGAAGPAAVQVTNPDTQSGSLAGGFTFVPAPTVTNVNPNSGPAAGGTAITITGTAFQSGATVTIGGTAATSVVFVNATTITAVTPAGAAGAANVQVTNPDTQSGTLAAGFTYFAAPTVTNVSPNSGPTAGGTSITITGTAFRAGATVTVGGNPATSVVVVNATTITATTPAGAGTVGVQVTNSDAQSGSLASAFTYVPPPTVSNVSPNSGPAGGGTSITITGTGFLAGAAVTVGGNPATSVVVVNATQITATTPAGAGTVAVQVTNTDTQSASLPAAFTFVPGPTVTNVSPNSGPIVGGTFINVTGTNFQAGATVRVGGTLATSVNFINTTTLTGVTPAGVAGAAAVQVTNPDTQSGTLAGGFTYVGPPTVTNVSPNTGDSAGGTSVTVTGTNFQPGAIVQFNNSPTTSVVFVNSTTLTTTTPPHAAGVVNVTVKNPDNQQGTLAGGYTYTSALPAPTITLVNPNTGPTSGGTVVTITGTAFQSGATVFFGGTAASSTIFNSSTQLTATTAPEAAGVVSVTVRNPDNSTGTLVASFTFFAPPTVTTVSPNKGPTAGGTAITITGANFQGGATVLVGGSPASSVVVANANQITATTPAGSGTVAVQVTNPDAQSGSLAGAFTFVPPPTVSSVSPNSGSVAGGTSVTITGTGFQSGATLTIGGTPATSVNFVSATTLTAVTPAGAAGPAAVQVTNPDTQSGSLAGGFTFVPAPTVTNVNPNSGPTAGGTAVTITGTGFQSGATVRFDSASATSVVFVNATTITAVAPAHAAGTANVIVQNPDTQTGTLAAGFTYFAPPTVTNVSPNSGPTAGGTSITITGTAFRAGAIVTVGSNPATSVVVVNATTITATTPAGAAGTVAVRVTNTDGQFGNLANAFTYLAPPTVTNVSPSSGPTAGGTSITITGTAFRAGATVTVGGNPATSVVVVNATQITATTPAGAGTVAVQVTNTDAQSGSLSNAFTFVPAPTVTSVSPNSGPTAGGTSVTITGTNFSAGATVLFGVISASSVTVDSPTQIRTVSPAGSAGATAVTVRNTDNQQGSLAGAFTYVSPPTVGSVAPTSGPTAGGTSVVISGSNFLSGATVRFGATPATSVTFNNASQLTATAPAHAAGLVSVTVTNPDSQSSTLNNAFTYIAPPSLSSVSPASGPLAGGTLVTIFGSAFQNGASVTFGGTPATTVVVTSSTQISAITPARPAGTVSVVVQNPDGQTGTLANAFTYSPAPTISGVNPNAGPTTGGTSVTITGSNFVAGAQVFFGGSPANNVNVGSATQITADTPSHAAGLVTVQVVNPDSQAGSLANAFTYSAPPQPSSASPNTGLTTGGTVVFLLGTGFQNGANVMFGSTASSSVIFGSSTQLTATTPSSAAGTVNIVVINPDGQAGTLTNGFSFTTPAPPPTIGAVTPDTGPQAGGTLVTITGTNFQSGATVQFGSVLGTGVVFVNSTTLTVLTPANPSGPVNVTVANPDGQFAVATGAFGYSVSAVLITTTALPVGLLNVPYSAAMSATGGALPYTWTIAGGQVPPGLGINAFTGAFTGTVTQAGTYTFNVQVADAAAPSPQTAVGAFTLVVRAVGASEPAMPQTFLDTTMPAMTGNVIRVAAGGDVQAAINAANCGDTIRLERGATFTGRFTLQPKSCDGWILIRTDTNDLNLPPEGVRITPDFAPVLAKLSNNNGLETIRTSQGAKKYRLMGIEITQAVTVTTNFGIVVLGTSDEPTVDSLPSDIVLDRVWVHGNTTGNFSRCVAFNAKRLAVIDSYLSDCHIAGGDAQAVGGWSGPGPYKIVNNHLEGAGENILFGGAGGSLSGITDPSDIEIRRNHLFKPLSWRQGDPSFAGILWTVKNLLELKAARRVLVDGNILDFNWLMAQTGIAVLFTPRIQGGTDNKVLDITFRYNIVRHSGSGLNTSGIDSDDTTIPRPLRCQRVLIQDNLFDDITNTTWGGDGFGFLFQQGAAFLTVDHNTNFGTRAAAFADGTQILHQNFVSTNNLWGPNQFGFAGSGTTEGTSTLNFRFPGAIFLGDILVGRTASLYPAGNFFPSTISGVGFLDFLNKDFRLAPTSPFKNAGTDGKDVGADIAGQNASVAGVIRP